MKSFFFVKSFSLLLAFFCLVCTANLSAQNKKIDSLLQEIKKLQSIRHDVTADTNLIECYYSIAEEYLDLDNLLKEQAYTQKALDLISLMLGRTISSGELKKYLLHEQALGYGNIGSYYEAISDYSKALDFHFKALKIDESIGNKRGELRHLGNIGIIYGDLGEYKKALDYDYKSLAIAKTLHSIEDEVALYGNIGGEYNYLKNYEMSLQYYSKALDMYKDLKDSASIAMMLGNFGNVYGDLGDNELDKGIDPKDIADYYTAIVYYKKALSLYENIGDKRNKSILLGSLGDLYMIIKKYDLAKKMLFESLALSEDLHYLEGVMEINKSLSLLYSDLGDSKKSFEHYKNYIDAKDSIFSGENTKKNVETEMNFEFEKKEAIQKAEHEKEVIALEAENRIQKNTRNYIILLALMLLLLVASGFVYFNNKKTLQLREVYSQQLLAAQEKEKQRISKELHDSIGQNLLFIKNQMIKNNDLRLMPSVDETLEEVRNISKDLYPNQLEKYGLVAAIEALAEKAKEASDIFISYDLEGFNKNITADKQINYYRIIQECISNTIKHADATALRITARNIVGEIELIVQDNGKGFNKSNMAKNAQRSFGMLNIEERVKYMKGSAILETSVNKGTKHTFIIPA